jgi:hypothetical protein
LKSLKSVLVAGTTMAYCSLRWSPCWMTATSFWYCRGRSSQDSGTVSSVLLSEAGTTLVSPEGAGSDWVVLDDEMGALLGVG